MVMKDPGGVITFNALIPGLIKMDDKSTPGYMVINFMDGPPQRLRGDLIPDPTSPGSGIFRKLENASPGNLFKCITSSKWLFILVDSKHRHAMMLCIGV